MTDRLTELKACLDRGEITRSGYLRALRELRDAGGITAHAYTSAVGQAQREVLALRGISTPRLPRRRAPAALDHDALDWSPTGGPAFADPDNGPLGKKDLQSGTPTQNIGIDDVMGVAGSDDGLSPEPDHRGSAAVRMLRKIVRQNPDASLAVSTAKRVASTKYQIRCYEIGKDGPTETPAPAAEAEARRFVRRVMRSHGGGGIEALLAVGLESIITDGAIAVELDVAKTLDDVRDIVPVDVTLVRFQTRTMSDGQRVLVPVYKPASGEAKPFNINQFAYSGLDTTVTDPYGRPWILPVLDTAPAQHKLRNTIHKVMVHQGYARLAAKVDWNRVAEQMPMTATTPEEKRSYMRKVLGGITDNLKDLKPDDAVALYDFVTLTVLGANHGSQSVKSQELVDIYDTDNAAALKTPPSILGRAVGTSLSTNADIHWWVYALAIEALRLHVMRVVSWAISQYLRIRGIAAYAVLEFEPIRKTDAEDEENTLKTKQERLLAALAANLIDEETARAEMGYPTPAAGRATPAATRTSATDHDLALDDDGARFPAEALVVGLVTPCTKCGAPNLRRPGRQSRCRRCGAYLCARLAAVEAPEPDLEAVIVDVARDIAAAGLAPAGAREFVEAYADTMGTLGLDDEIDCPECTPPARLARAAKFEPKKPTAAGAIELGQEYAFPGDDDGADAADAWRDWAAERAPDLTEVLFAPLYEEDDEDDEDRTTALDAWRTGNLAKPKGWMWDARVQGYREAAHPMRVLSEAVIDRVVERRIADHRALFKGLSDRLEAGQISVANWQRGIAKSLKETHLQLRMLAVGGKEQMTQRHYGSVGGLIRADTDRLARFGQQVARGELTMPQIQARAQLYGQANLRREYDRGREMGARDASWAQERRELDDNAEHCKGCAREGALGWVDAGTLSPIGGHECRGMDHCRIRRRYSAKEPVPPKPTKTKKATRGDDGRARDTAIGRQVYEPAILLDAYNTVMHNGTGRQ